METLYLLLQLFIGACFWVGFFVIIRSAINKIDDILRARRKKLNKL